MKCRVTAVHVSKAKVTAVAREGHPNFNIELDYERLQVVDEFKYAAPGTEKGGGGTCEVQTN